jgi:hypothetical protein
MIKMFHRGPLEWNHLPTKYREDYHAVISGGHTDRQTGDFISLL